MSVSTLPALREKALVRANEEKKVFYIVIDARKEHAITSLMPNSFEWRKKNLTWVETVMPTKGE